MTNQRRNEEKKKDAAGRKEAEYLVSADCGQS